MKRSFVGNPRGRWYLDHALSLTLTQRLQRAANSSGVAGRHCGWALRLPFGWYLFVFPLGAHPGWLRRER